MMANSEHGFVGFEYLEVSAKRSMESMYVDGYRNFGWKFEGASAQEAGSGAVRLKFKRDRRIPSKAELTRLQRQFEACALEIEALERSKTTAAAIAAFTIGLAGSAFLGGAVFAYLNGLLPLMVILAVPLDRPLLLLSEDSAAQGGADRAHHRAEKRRDLLGLRAGVPPADRLMGEGGPQAYRVNRVSGPVPRRRKSVRARFPEAANGAGSRRAVCREMLCQVI